MQLSIMATKRSTISLDLCMGGKLYQYVPTELDTQKDKLKDSENYAEAA